MKYWQITADSDSRDYSGDFLKYDLIRFARFATFDMKRGIMREFRAKIDGLVKALRSPHQQAAQQQIPFPQQNED